MKNIVKRLIRDEKGQTLIMVLILLVLGGLIVPPLLGLMSTGLHSGRVYETKMHEYYAADAGVEDAIWKIIMNDVDELPNSSCGNQSWSYNYSIPDINNRDVEVTIEYFGDFTHLITSTATSDDGSSTTVQASATLDVEITEGEGFFSGSFNEFDDFGPDDFDEDGYYYGNVQTDGDVEVIIDGTIVGDAWAQNGNIKLLNGANITGSVVAWGTSSHSVTLETGAVIGGHVCAGTIELKEGARIGGTAYATCTHHDEMCATPYEPCSETGASVILNGDDSIVEGDAYAEYGDVSVKKPGAKVLGNAYAAFFVYEESGGDVVGDPYEGYNDWPGCPLCGGSSSGSTITGVDIGYWQIS